MKPVRTTRSISASIDLVFQTLSDPQRFCEAVPHITNVEFLSNQHTGIGTRFRETRVMKGRESTVELEVTDYVENERIRMVSDAGGTIWDSVFTVKVEGGTVEMTMQMDIRPHTLMAKIMMPMIGRMVVEGVETDMDAIKDYCESS